MNAKTLALAFALGASFSAMAQSADIVTLETVQVRPSADQIAQAQYEAASGIPTLATVEVRPGPELLATAPAIVTLAAVEVRPDAELYAALAAEQAAEQQQYRASVMAAVGQQLSQWADSLPLPQMSGLGLELGNNVLDAAASLVTP